MKSIIQTLPILLFFFASIASSRAAAPTNDNLNNAAPLTGASVVEFGSNVAATKEVGEPNHGPNVGGKSVWWKWTAPSSGSVIIETTGSTFDTLLAAYTGSSFGTLSTASSNDDNGSRKTSLIGFNVDAGTIYLIAVDGYDGDFGTIQLTITFQTKTLQRPSNDDFSKRVLIEGIGVTVTNSNFFATKETGEPSHADELGGASVWWSWKAPMTGSVTIGTEGSTTDTLLAVYTGSVLTNLAEVASNDDMNTNTPISQVTFNAVAGRTYQIAVDGYDGEPGDIQLNVQMHFQLSTIQFNLPEKFAPQGLRLTILGFPGAPWTVQTSTNLLTWSNLVVLTNDFGIAQFDHADARSGPRRYYRVKSP